MYHLLLVMAGGALGSAARFLVGRATLRGFGPDFPYGTLTVNLVGGFAMGVLAGFLARHSAGENWRLLLGVGVWAVSPRSRPFRSMSSHSSNAAA